MEPIKLADGEEETLKAERTTLRSFISAIHRSLPTGAALDLNHVQAQYRRYMEIQLRLLQHALASGENIEADEAKDEEYAEKMRNIVAHCKPAVTQSKPTEIKLPKVEEDSPASWQKFLALLDSLAAYQQMSEQQKYLQLVEALPAHLAIQVTGLSFKDGVALVKEHFESDRAVINCITRKLRELPKIEDQCNLPALRRLHRELIATLALSHSDKVRDEVFKLAVIAMPHQLRVSFINVEAELNAASLRDFLGRRIKGIEVIESAIGRPMFTQRPAAQQANKPQQQQKQASWKKGGKKPKQLNAVQSDEEEEEENKNVHPYPPLYDLMAVRKRVSSDAIFIKGTISGKPIELLWDPGAVKTLLPASFFPGAKLEKRFSSATGHPIRASAPKMVTLVVNGSPLQIEVHVNDYNLALLGRPFTKRCSMRSNGEKVVQVVYHLRGKDVVIFESKPSETKRTEAIFAVLPCATEDDLLFEDEDEQPTTTTTSAPPALKQLLSKWAHLGEGLGVTDLVTHRLYVKPGTRPITVPNRRMPEQYKAKAREAVSEMIRLGVIRESTSEWCSAVVPVRKKDGSIRIAVDYRKLNEVCAKDAYPMPRIDEIVERLTKAAVFSTLDLKKGYYQVRMHPEDAEKTAFRFEDKLYEFDRMPFGLVSAPQTFMRLMNRVLAPFPFATAYLDDVVVFSSSLEEHRQHLEKVFKAIRAANLRLNMQKCSFGRSEVVYLGFNISKDKRRPSDDKLQKLRSFPAPTTKKELATFLGIANQYRELVANFADKSSPLFELNKQTKNKAPLVWRPEHQVVFEALKKELTRPPVVALPDASKPFIVKVDASGTGMGAVLLQEDAQGRRQVVEYASQTFKGAQLRYPTIEKEATAIDFALKKWRHFLLGGKFKLETDHRPLQWLRGMKDTHGKLGRMAMRIGQYEPFEVVHIPGKENVEADYLSRLVSEISLDYSQQDDIFFRHQKKPADFITDAKGRLRFVGDGRDRLAVPRKHRAEVLKALHDDYGHLSVDRVLSMARSRLFWPGMANDVKKHIQACRSCALNKDVPLPKSERKSTATEVSLPFERWHVDVIENISLTSTKGSKCILVAQDAFSKWPVALPVKRCTAGAIISWLKTEIFNRFGKPEQIMTDHGSVFDSKEFSEFLKREGVEHLTSAVYHHETNGLVERFNRTLEEMIRTNGAQSADWDDEVNKCLMVYRNTVHKVTRRSPYEVVYGKKPSLPIDDLLDVEPPRTPETLEQIHDEVRRRIREAAVREKKKYDKDKKVSWRDLHGKKVYWKDFQASPKAGKHFAPRFKGPFLAERTSSRWNYRITDREGKWKVVNANQLKECHDDGPLATGLRGRGRPPNRIQSILVYPSNR